MFLLLTIVIIVTATNMGNSAKEEIGSRAVINQEYQLAWQGISSNIDNTLPLANVIIQEYSEVTKDPSYENRFVDINALIKQETRRNEKYNYYVDMINLIAEVEEGMETNNIDDNKVLSVGVNNMAVFNETIRIMTEEYNVLIDKYNDTFGLVINKENKSKGIVKGVPL